MPQSPQKIPSYRLHRASGQAIVTLSGKDIYLGRHDTPASHRKYEQVVSEWLANHRQPPASSKTGAEPDTAGLNVESLFVAYWRYCQSYYVGRDGAPSKECLNIRDALRPMVITFGDKLVSHIRPSVLQATRNMMIDSGLARKTINARVNRIRRMFRWGVENDLVPPSVLHGLQAVSPLKKGRGGVRESPPVKPVPEESIEAVLPFLPPTLQAMVRVQQYSGMRPGELVIIRSCDIDMSGQIWSYCPPLHKTEYLGYARTVYLGTRAQEFLAPYLKHDLESYIFSPRQAMQERHQKRPQHRRQVNRHRLTRRKLSERYTPGSYLRAIYYACDQAFPPPPPLARIVDKQGKRESDRVRRQRLTKAQLKELRQWQSDHRWHPNQLRHNAATYLRKEFGIEAARVVLGHRSAGVTEIYAEVDQEKAIDIISKVG